MAELTRQTDGRNLDKAGSAKVAIMHTFEFEPAEVVDLRSELTLGSFFSSEVQGLQNVSFWYQPAGVVVLSIDDSGGSVWM